MGILFPRDRFSFSFSVFLLCVKDNKRFPYLELERGVVLYCFNFEGSSRF